jgi:SAM-dependent methyltransferase
MGIVSFPRKFMRSRTTDQDQTVLDGRTSLEEVATLIGVDDLGDVELLDIGCGVKFTQAILSFGLPMRAYAGVDVYGEMIQFLRGQVSDPRFTFAHLDAHNDLYNPSGAPMSPDLELGVGDRAFDVVTMYSVVTHLNPDDFRTILAIALRHARPGAWLFFTAFLNELTAGGHGFIDNLGPALEAGVNPEATEAARRAGVVTVEPFVDADPSQPLMYALYSRQFATEIVGESGWGLVDVLDPLPHRQHLFVCRAPA